MDILGLIALAKSQNGSPSASKVFHFKGVKSAVNLLPIQGEEGDVYKVEEDNNYYAWNETTWVNIGDILTADQAADLINGMDEDIKSVKSALDLYAESVHVINEHNYQNHLTINSDTGVASYIQHDSYAATDYVELIFPYIYINKRVNGGLFTVCMFWYSADKTYLSYSKNTDVTNVGGYSVFAPPTGARYCRIAFFCSGTNSFFNKADQYAVFADVDGTPITEDPFGYTVRQYVDSSISLVNAEINTIEKYTGMFVNVVELGADNTGATDASAIINSALETYNSLYFPCGTYKFNSAILIPSGKTLTGENAVLKLTSASAYISVINVSNITLEGITIEGPNDESLYVLENATKQNEKSGVVNNSSCLSIKNSSNISVRSCTFKDANTGANIFASTTYPHAHDIFFEDCIFTMNYAGIITESGIADGIYNLTYINCSFVDNLRWGEWMEMDNATNNAYLHDITHINCLYKGQKYEHGAYIKGRNIKYIACSFISNNIAGLRMYAIADAIISKCYFRDNGYNAGNYWNYSHISATNGNSALFIGEETSSDSEAIRSNGATIDGNVFYHNGAAFGDYKRDHAISFSNNKCIKNGAVNNGNIVDIRSELDSTISNNIFIDNIANYCIVVQDHGNSNLKNITVKDNIISRQTGGGIKFKWGASETDCSNVCISGNEINACTGSGIFINMTSSGRKIDNLEIKDNTVTECGENGCIIDLDYVDNIIRGLWFVSNVFRSNTGDAIEFVGALSGESMSKITSLFLKNNTAVSNRSDAITVTNVDITQLSEIVLT